MLKEDLFKELSVDNIEFNGDVELTDAGVLWSLKLSQTLMLDAWLTCGFIPVK